MPPLPDASYGPALFDIVSSDVGFCSLSLFFVGLDRAKKSKGIEKQMNNNPVETFGLYRALKTASHASLDIKQSSFVHSF